MSNEVQQSLVDSHATAQDNPAMSAEALTTKNNEQASKANNTVQTKRYGSIVAIVVLLALAALAWAVVQCTNPSVKDVSNAAKVTVDNEVVAMLPLSQDARQVVYSAEGANTVVVENGAVHIEEADCKGGDCMKQGSIDAPGRLLVCLPHRLIVEIVPQGAEGQSAPSVYTGEELVGSSEVADIDIVAR